MQKVFEVMKNKTVLLGMLAVAAFGLVLIGYKNFSMDELDTIFTIRDLPTLHQVMWFREGNMWLYYSLLYFWGLVSHAEAWIRAFSVVFAVATVPVVFALGKELFGVRVARIATLLMSVNIFLIANAQNARAYTMVLFLTAASTYCFVRYAREGSRKFLVAVALLNVLAVYAHLYALFVIGAQFLALFWARQKARWPEAFGAYAATGLLVLPLFVAPAFHAQPMSWIQAPGIRNLIGTFIILANDFWPVAVLYAGMFVVLATRLWRQRGWAVLRPEVKTWPYALVLLLVGFPVAASFIFSLAVKPLYISAYFFVCLVPFTLLAAAGLAAIRREWLRRVLVVLIVVLAMVRLGGWYGGSHSLELVIPNNNEAWSKAAAYLRANTQAGEAVLFFPSMDRDKVNYYLGGDTSELARREIILQPYFLTTGQMVKSYDNAKLQSLAEQYSRVWFVLERVTGKDTDAETAVIEAYLKSHYSLKRVEHLESLEIYTYEK